MVDLTSVILALRSSLCEMGVGNLPAGIKSASLIRLRSLGGAGIAYLSRDRGLGDEGSA